MLVDKNHDPKHIYLTAAEIGILWNNYMIESLVHHIYIYFLKHVEDPDVKDFNQYIVDTTRENLGSLESIFKQENLPVPRGITSDDVNPNAPRLFTDKYYILFAEYMSRFGLSTYSLAYTLCSRLDIREYLKKYYVDRLMLINKKIVEISLTKGVHVRPPYIPTPNEVDFVQRKSFFAGFFGKKRPLTVLEITHLFTNAHANLLGQATLIGYSQIAKSTEVREHLLRGRNMANDFYKELAGILARENIPAPPGLSAEVLDTAESPFTDRIMLFHDTILSSTGLGNYGMAIAMSPRNDLAALYGKMAVKSGSYAKEGAELMIKNGWMEQPPTAPDHDALVKDSQEKR